MVNSTKDFRNGRIYKILNYVDNECYVGSTTQALSKRMVAHRAAVYRSISRNIPLYIKMREAGVENFYIELIEEYPCDNIEQLRMREGRHIRELGTLNKRVAGNTKEQSLKQHRENNKEAISQKKKDYRSRNRELLAERRKTTYTCACGIVCRVDCKARHERTKKHQTFIANSETSNPLDSVDTN